MRLAPIVPAPPLPTAVRPLEVVFLVALLLAGISLWFAPERRPRWLRIHPALPITLALVHVFIDHGRWQLYLAYGVAGVLSIIAVIGMRSRDEAAIDRPWARRLGGTAIVLVAGATILLAAAVPVFSLPEPTGKLKVGSRWIVLTDSSREEALTPEPGDHRRVVVRVWYPADSVQGEPDSYIEEPVARAIATGLKLPGIVLSHLTLVPTHSYRRAWLPPTPARFPLILFSHGYAIGTESQNTVQMEELASQGFVVASIDHPYEAGAILMPGDSLLRPRLPFDALGDTAAVRRMNASVARLKVARDTTEVAALVRELYAASTPLETSIVRWTDDTRFVLERLTAMSGAHDGADTLLTGRLATDRVGLYGMSFGGATAAGFCATDARCAAGMNLDGLLYGIAGREPLTRPFFFASSADNAPLHRLMYERATGPAWMLTVEGSNHMDYTDFARIAPQLAVRSGMLGGIAPKRMEAIMNTIAVAFFDQALRGGPGLDSAQFGARFPEATLVSHGARSNGVVADSTVALRAADAATPSVGAH